MGGLNNFNPSGPSNNSGGNGGNGSGNSGNGTQFPWSNFVGPIDDDDNAKDELISSLVNSKSNK